MVRLAIVGGGGFRVPLVYRALLARPDLGITELVLTDTSPARLAAILSVLRPAEHSIRVRAESDLEPAIRDADFVFSAIRVGGAAGRVGDERRALARGVLGQETVGAGADVLRFFKQIDASVERGLSVHVVLDNLSAHSTPEIMTWLSHRDRRRWHLHFTPTSSSWVNLIERWFKELTDRRLRRGVFTSVPDLTAAITTWAEHWNQNPKPFIWKATAEDIITKVQRGPRHTPPDRNADGPLGPGRSSHGHRGAHCATFQIALGVEVGLL